MLSRRDISKCAAASIQCQSDQHSKSPYSCVLLLVDMLSRQQLIVQLVCSTAHVSILWVSGC